MVRWSITSIFEEGSIILSKRVNGHQLDQYEYRHEGRRPMHKARLEPRGTVCSESPPENLLLPGTTNVKPPTVIQSIHHRSERINKIN